MAKTKNTKTLYSGPGKLKLGFLADGVNAALVARYAHSECNFLPEDNAALLGLRPRRATDRVVGLRGACQRPDSFSVFDLAIFGLATSEGS